MFTNNLIFRWTKSPFKYWFYGLLLLIGISTTGIAQEIAETNIQNLDATGLEAGWKKSGQLSDENAMPEAFADFHTITASSIYLDQNIVETDIVLNLPEELRHAFTIEIYNLNGFKLLQRRYYSNLSSKIILNISRECPKNGVYIMRYYNNAGISKTLKFRKIMST